MFPSGKPASQSAQDFGPYCYIIFLNKGVIFFMLKDVRFGTHPSKYIPCGYCLTMVRAKR